MSVLEAVVALPRRFDRNPIRWGPVVLRTDGAVISLTIPMLIIMVVGLAIIPLRRILSLTMKRNIPMPVAIDMHDESSGDHHHRHTTNTIMAWTTTWIHDDHHMEDDDDMPYENRTTTIPRHR